MKFRPSAEVEEFIESVHLRVGARNKAVLGRAGLFLALGEGVPSEFRPKDAQGKDLDDDTVIGDELRDVVLAALNYRAGKSLDDAGYRTEFRKHFEYGCLRLKQIWEDSGNDQTQFVVTLISLARDGIGGQHRVSGTRVRPMSVVNDSVSLRLLTDTDPWVVNEAGHNGLLVISGKPGTGKSQLALDLLAQVAGQGVRFLFFDLKGELEDDISSPQQKENRERFLSQTGTKYVRLINERLPINPLIRADADSANAQVAYETASLIRAFAPQLGAKQERSIADAYRSLACPDFPGLALQLDQMGASGVESALVHKIVDLNLFADWQTAISPEDWLKSSLVIDFKGFGSDNATKSLAVALVLNFLMKRLNQNLGVSNGIQPLKMVLFVDEAHLLLPQEGKAGLLGSLARQGRSWGFPVWLASQDADAFITTGPHGTDFAELASCGIHLSPETLTTQEQRQILGHPMHQQLKQGQAVLRLNGHTRVGEVRQFWRDKGIK